MMDKENQWEVQGSDLDGKLTLKLRRSNDLNSQAPNDDWQVDKCAVFDPKRVVLRLKRSPPETVTKLSENDCILQNGYHSELANENGRLVLKLKKSKPLQQEVILEGETHWELEKQPKSNGHRKLILKLKKSKLPQKFSKRLQKRPNSLKSVPKSPLQPKKQKATPLISKKPNQVLKTGKIQGRRHGRPRLILKLRRAREYKKSSNNRRSTGDTSSINEKSPAKYIFAALIKWYKFYGLAPPLEEISYDFSIGRRPFPPNYGNGEPLWPFVYEFRQAFKNYKIPKLPRNPSPSPPIVDSTVGSDERFFTVPGSRDPSPPTTGLDIPTDHTSTRTQHIEQYEESSCSSIPELTEATLEFLANWEERQLAAIRPPTQRESPAPSTPAGKSSDEEDADILTLHPEVLDVFDVKLMRFCGMTQWL